MQLLSARIWERSPQGARGLDGAAPEGAGVLGFAAPQAAGSLGILQGAGGMRGAASHGAEESVDVGLVDGICGSVLCLRALSVRALCVDALCVAVWTRARAVV